MKLKVIQIIDSLNVGGAEVLAVNIANSLIVKGIESHLCVTRKEGYLNKLITQEVGYIHLKRSKTIDIKAIRKLSNYIKKNDISIVHAHSTSYFVAICVKIFIPSIKIIWHDHYGKSEFLKNTSRMPIQMLSFMFSSVIVVNSKLLNWSKKHLAVKKVFFLRNFPLFIDLKKTTYMQGVKGKRIVHVAGFREQKDHINLLQAFLIVLKYQPEYTLHFIGKNYEGSYFESVKNFINDKNLSNNVFIYGICSDIKHILEQSSIGVLSSKSEGLPISLLEYGLAKLPVVITDVGECADVVKNKECIVTAKNSDKLASAILLLINDKNLKTKVALDLHNEVLINYSKEVVINLLIKMYNNQ